MRGKVHHGVSVHALKRITPAYAGKRGHKVRLQAAGRDHPRVCGEKAVIHLKVRFFTGSPPRMRGKDVPWSFNQGLGGITPAYAGKSAFGLLSSAESGDHPRVCGEKRVLSSPSFAKIGSPPRMRGKEGVALLSGQIVGITPAYAGKRAAANFHLGTTRDHPRVCGEKRMPPRIGFWLRGSPPHVRGKD